MNPSNWQFIDDHGTFQLPDPSQTSYLYFPLLNEAGMMSVITPDSHGDAKTSQNSYLLQPVSVDDLHNTRSARNFWVRINGSRSWSVTGNSAEQATRRLGRDKDASLLTAGLLWQTVQRTHAHSGLQAQVTSFVPVSTQDQVELMRVTLKNTGGELLTLTPTAAIPIYGRSADNLRDHRHVTSLLHRTVCTQHGVLVRPTLSFDERGHTVNTLTYAVLGAGMDGQPPAGFFPLLEDFIGEGGALDWPEAVVSTVATQPGGSRSDGYESLGGIRFEDVELAPGEEASYIILMGIVQDGQTPDILLEKYASNEKFERALTDTQSFWQAKISTLTFETGDARLDGWLKWVTLQPTLRRMMGNSFLPYHDYGRGGRGWRDLWQDVLALLMVERGDVSEMLLGYFGGVRADGSNATIIGSQPGEFRADRNNIPRVWMDHGVWPLLTTRLYIDQSGDLQFLLREQGYFKDHLSHRCSQTDADWSPEQGTHMRSADGSPYRGSILEHLLIQHLTAFYNVGEHNNILLEGADWNDGLDMARTRGESVAFSALYAGNLRVLADLCLALSERGFAETEQAAELASLLDGTHFDSVREKQERLQSYFDQVQRGFSGTKICMPLVELSASLRQKADWLAGHIRKQEWLDADDGLGWFNGYYDDDGQPVDRTSPSDTRMTLTGQVFTLMCGIASDEQARKISASADRHLYDPSLRGYRLNTDFGEVRMNLGRAFGFAYGHKENGAMFSHMAVMYANALYKRGLAREGWRVLEGIYQQSQDFPVSRMYPGIPEYFNPRGRGMYPYLTGSASWYLLTMLTEVYGVRGELGDLLFAPKLLACQFNAEGQTTVHTLFAGKKLQVTYRNQQGLEYGQYKIGRMLLNGQQFEAEAVSDGVKMKRHTLDKLPEQVEILVELEKIDA
jgi:cellobiose phosphorylase